MTVVAAGASSGSGDTGPAKRPTELAKIGGISELLDGDIARTVTHVAVVYHVDVDANSRTVEGLQREVGKPHVKLLVVLVVVE
jgi:hypothetical protein